MYEASTVTDTGAVIIARHELRAMALAELASMLLTDISIDDSKIHQNDDHVLVYVDNQLKLSMTIKKV